jgi:L-alanine-DL-glutamate epimerase-like enolase superfamily enzyme
MTIAEAESWILRFPSDPVRAERKDEFFELIGVTLRDSSGERGSGWTFTSDYGGGEAVKALLDSLLLHRVVGRTAEEVEAVAVTLRQVTHRLGDGLASMAISATDIALWDLRARLRGLSLAAALGQVRTRVPAYGSGKASPTLELDELVRLSVDYAASGFRALKLRVGRDLRRDVARVAAVRQAVGPEMRIMCDANERLDLPAALWLGRQLAAYDIY